MRAWADSVRRDGLRLCVVPTMGYLHEGHLALIRAGRVRADIVVVTIFVNPLQFAANEDLGSYPRDEAGDIVKARGAGADVVFCPRHEELYPKGFQTHVEVEDLSRPLCGSSRPSHFRGVATVVTKLFHLTKPHLAVFGQKDYQQLALIRRMVEDLDFGIEILGIPIMREDDGLAMSSRNAYLRGDARGQALCLYRGLRAAEVAYSAGERTSSVLLGEVQRVIATAQMARIDYVEMCHPHTLQPLTEVADDGALIAVAVFIEYEAETEADAIKDRTLVRLIDNLLLQPSPS